MNEESLHFIWKYLLFDTSNLVTTFGEKVSIVKNGTHNTNQGPDFLNAKLKIGETLYIGNVEIHIKNEDWYSHKHTQDKNYDNTILHVVLKKTAEIYTLNSSNNSIPILVLDDYISKHTIENIEKIIESKHTIPCQQIFKKPEEIKILSFKNKLLIERLDKKSDWIFKLFFENNYNIETTFYQVMLYGFGLKVNADIFLDIAKSLPQNVLAKHNGDLFQLEALLFGQANMLESTDDYALKLRAEYQYLKRVYSLNPITNKPLFSKLMPPSFPTIRLAQFAAFIHNQHGLYSKLIELKTIKEFKPYFDISVSEYWLKRYNFSEPNSKISVNISEVFINKIILNVIIPLLYTLDKYHNKDTSRIVEILSELPPESNSILKNMHETLELSNKNAYDSQAIIEWYNTYCTHKKCMECIIGLETMK